MTRIAYVAASLSLALIACRGGDDGPSGDDDPGSDAGSGSGSNAGEVTIMQVQSDDMPSGTQVTLKNVVVSAIDTYGARTGDLFVQDPAGGPFSGVKVFGASLDVLAQLAVGDTVNITNAIKHEACNAAAPCGSVIFDDGASITEVMGVSAGALTITKVSSGATLTPTPVDALAISKIADETARLAEWEKWEGVFITVQNARQTTELATFSQGNDDQRQFTITGGAKVQTVLANVDANPVGTCYAGITGVGDFFFDYLVLPRSSTELSTGGTGCETVVVTPATIPEIQAGTKTGLVALTDVYVSAVTFNKKNFWVSTSLNASADNGIYVFRCSGSGCSGTAELASEVVVGAKVTIQGTTAEFGSGAGETVSQLTTPTITVTAAPSAPVVPVTGQTVASLLAAATGEPYEGVLVTLTNVKVNVAGTNGGTPVFGISDLAQFPGDTAFKSDDDIYRMVAGDMSACWASVTGIWTWNPYDDRYQFLPTAAGTGTGTCE